MDGLSKQHKRNICKRKRKHKKGEANKRYKDVHHLCYYKKDWRKSFGASKLREFWYCRMPIPKDTLHRRIHTLVPYVPVPKSVNALAALEQLRSLERYDAIHDTDPIERRLMLLIALFDCVEQPTADAFRAQLEIAREFYIKKPSE